MKVAVRSVITVLAKPRNALLTAVLAVALGVVLLGLILATNHHPGPNATISESSVTQPELVIGDSAAPVTITQYGDFKCPVCNQFFHTTEPQLTKDFIDTGKVKLVFKNLAQIGPDSITAAEGGFCAAEQKRFKDYHDAVYNYIWDTYYAQGKNAEATTVFTTNTVETIAKDSGLETEKFDQCLESHKYETAVNNDVKLARQQNFYATPTFVVGNQVIQGAQPYQVFKTLIEGQMQ